jgi:hypothetical protein
MAESLFLHEALNVQDDNTNKVSEFSWRDGEIKKPGQKSINDLIKQMPDVPFKNMKEALKFGVQFNQKLLDELKRKQDNAKGLADARLIIKS